MKTRNILLAPIWLIAMASTLFSCGEDRWPEYAEDTDLDMWIDSVMRQEYLWYYEMPSVSPKQYFLAPASFLSQLIYTTLDRNYSHIDSLHKVSSPEYGFDYTLYQNADIDTLYNALITNVRPGSPAAEAGLQRGGWIMKVNDVAITKKNEQNLLQTGDALTLTLGKYELEKVEGSDQTEQLKGVVTETGTTHIGSWRIVEEDPIPAYEIVTSATGVKVGYLAYDLFEAGTLDDEEKYNNRLRDISREFAEAGITHFVLDLRNNTGGTFECAQLLASLLAPESMLGSTFAHLEYNDKQSHKDSDLLFDRQLIGNGANMNIERGFILTGSSTTALSGTLYDCLLPLGNWEIVGTSLPAMGVATDRFVNAKHNWVLNLVTCTVYNAANESHSGGSFTANYAVDPTSTANLATYLPLGNKEETLLSTALGVIDGTYPPLDEETK